MKQFTSAELIHNKLIDPLQVALLVDTRFSVLPELYEVFGPSALLEFLDIFGGATIKIPTREELEVYLRDVIIYANYNEKRRSLCTRYNLTDSELLTIYNRMKTLLETTLNLNIIEAEEEPDEPG